MRKLRARKICRNPFRVFDFTHKRLNKLGEFIKVALVAFRIKARIIQRNESDIALVDE